MVDTGQVWLPQPTDGRLMLFNVSYAVKVCFFLGGYYPPNRYHLYPSALYIFWQAMFTILCIFCIIYKRVTDDEANKLFYFLQKYSREWPLLNNITWEENGAIFTDVTYGGFIIIVIGLIIGQASGELQYHRKTENFFLIMGALMFIAAGSLELAALDSVEERLVDNAAILGVVSLITGFIFILDLLLGGKRRKKSRLEMVRKKTAPKTTQTENTKIMEVWGSSDMNGNIHKGGYFPNGDSHSKRIPRNGVKILPSSPALEQIESAPPVYTVSDLKTPEGRIRSTESFLRSEKGEYVRRSEIPKEQMYIPPGYVLMPVEIKNDEGKRESMTPPGYASIITDMKNRPLKAPPGYVVVPIDQLDLKKDDTRKLQSPTITTTIKTPNGYYEDSSLGRTPQASLSNLSLSDGSDDEMRRRSSLGLKRHGKYSPEYPSSKPIFFSDRADSRLSHKSLQDIPYLPKGRLNHGYEDDGLPFHRNGSNRSSKPKSILRFDRIRLSKKEGDIDGRERYDSLDSRKIAEDLRHLKEITKSDVDLTHDLENENEILKRKLRREKEETEKLKEDLRKQLEGNSRESQRRKLEERINELEDMEKLMQLERKVRELEEKKNREKEEEKDRRMSEREEQYFGITDLKQSHRESSPVARRRMMDIEQNMKKQGEGVKKVNEKLKEKIHEQEDKARDEQEFRKVIDEGFYFLDEEEKRRKRGRKVKTPSPDGSDESPISQMTDEEIRLRIETPTSSYKSEAQVWLGSDGELRKESSGTPTSPGDPGFVLHTVQNWPETPSPSPHDRFRFSAKKAQHLKLSKTPTLETEDDDDEERKSMDSSRKAIMRKVEFTEVPVEEIRRPATVTGGTNSWKKWLQPKTKFHYTKSAPT